MTKISECIQKTQEEIDACERVLRGETVNGVKLGDNGIDREWVERTLRTLKSCLDILKNDPQQIHSAAEKFSIYDTRLKPKV